MSSFLADPSVQMVRCSLDKGRSPTPLTPRPPPHNVAADRTGVRAVRATPPSGRWLSSRAQRRLGGGRAEMKSQTAMSPSPPSPLLQLFPTASIAAVVRYCQQPRRGMAEAAPPAPLSARVHVHCAAAGSDVQAEHDISMLLRRWAGLVWAFLHCDVGHACPGQGAEADVSPSGCSPQSGRNVYLFRSVERAPAGQRYSQK